MKAPNYLGPILAAVAAGEFKKGAFFVEVAHDADCRIYRGQACGCACDITVSRADGSKFAVLADGSIMEAT